MMDKVSIITVNYNQPSVTIELLKSIKTHYPNIHQTILVDNASIENYVEEFSSVYPNVTFIRSKTNIGFAGGNNLGIAVATGDYIFLINNDTELVPGSIETMIAEFNSHPDMGLLSPLILYHHDRALVQYAGYSPLNYLTARNVQIGQFQMNDGQFDNQTYETGFCHGAAVMCRTSDLKAAGVMDESYFLYYEELDWCEKFKRSGKKIYFTGKTKIYHKESVSVGKESPLKTYFMTRNRMLFIRRNTGYLNTLIFSFYYLLIACPKMIYLHLKNKRPDLAKHVVKALVWNFTHDKKSKDLGFKLIG